MDCFTSQVSKKQAVRYLAFQMSHISFSFWVPSLRKILAIVHHIKSFLSKLVQTHFGPIPLDIILNITPGWVSCAYFVCDIDDFLFEWCVVLEELGQVEEDWESHDGKDVSKNAPPRVAGGQHVVPEISAKLCDDHELFNHSKNQKNQTFLLIRSHVFPILIKTKNYYYIMEALAYIQVPFLKPLIYGVLLRSWLDCSQESEWDQRDEKN